MIDRLGATDELGIDTEFVSEDTFYPELCLIQISTREEMKVVDPQQVDVAPFWRFLAEGERTVVLHAGREELNFILRSAGAAPPRLFDVQLAAAFCSNEYPSAYHAVVNRVLGEKPLKGEQRTDWRRRPLSESQIQYALEDVRHLLPLYDRLRQLLSERNRLGWLEEELGSWRSAVVAAQDRKDWRRVSGIGKLNGQCLAIVRELWLWRHNHAERINQPPKRVLRDDLLVEIAKRKVDRPDQILAIRGLQRNDLKRKADELAACVRRGLDAPRESRDRLQRRELPSQINILGQFLTPALTAICRRAEVAASLVGAAGDVRALIAHEMGLQDADDDGQPALTQDWRGELVGNLLEDLLHGRKSIRIDDPRRKLPLTFDDVAPAASD